MWNGQVYFESGTYIYNITTTQGSTVTLNLIVNNPTLSFIVKCLIVKRNGYIHNLELMSITQQMSMGVQYSEFTYRE